MSETADNTTRQIQVLGAKAGRRRRTRKIKSEEDENEDMPLATTTGSLLISKSQESIKVSSPPTTSVEPALPLPQDSIPIIKTKVVLKPKEKQIPKVLLKKKEIVPGPVNPSIQPLIEAKGGGSQMKVKTRKVVLNSFHKRINKTRHALSQAKELSIDSIRAVLIDKKLIKSNSKAPESILRQIYSDSLIVAKKTL